MKANVEGSQYHQTKEQILLEMAYRLYLYKEFMAKKQNKKEKK